MNRHTVWAAALSFLACGAPAAPTTAPAPAPAADASVPADAGAAVTDADGIPTPVIPKLQDAGSPREQLMRSHAKETAAVRAAILRGDLSATAFPVEVMGAMAEREGLPEAWRTPLENFRVVTRRLGRTSDVPGAAAAVADIGAACGSCHRTTGGPTVSQGAPPATDGSLASRMQRHVWAVERLWDGLSAPSDASWKAGADALSGEPFPKEVLDRGGVHARSYAGRFKTAVSAAGTAKKVDERAKAYASLLETCAACHTVTRPAK